MRIIIIFFLILNSCTHPNDAQYIIDKSIEAHGLDKLFDKALTFEFRGRTYGMYYENGQSIYTRSFVDEDSTHVRDILSNKSDFQRYVNGDIVTLDEDWVNRYRRSVNSVLYFAQLPLGLNDPAVNKEYVGKSAIRGQIYNKIRITFNQEGGGEDHEDIFVYWFNENTGSMDYLAYSYAVDGGGVRFREAFNKRKIDGVLFQDYINYEAPLGTALTTLDKLLERGELIELSRIQNKNILLTKLEH